MFRVELTHPIARCPFCGSTAFNIYGTRTEKFRAIIARADIIEDDKQGDIINVHKISCKHCNAQIPSFLFEKIESNIGFDLYDVIAVFYQNFGNVNIIGHSKTSDDK